GLLIGHDEDTAGRIEREGPGLESLRVFVLDQRRLTGVRAQREDGDVVLAAGENRPRRRPLAESAHSVVAIGEIEEAAVGMHVDRADTLLRLHVRRIPQGFLGVDRLFAERAALELVDMQLVAALDSDIDQGLGRMEIDVARTEARAGDDARLQAKRAVLERVGGKPSELLRA